jgi:hypothetical protein
VLCIVLLLCLIVIWSQRLAFIECGFLSHMRSAAPGTAGHACAVQLKPLHTRTRAQSHSFLSHPDAMQEVNSQWEPADLLPHRSAAIANSASAAHGGSTTDFRGLRDAIASAANGSREDTVTGAQSAPLLRHAQRFQAPAPAVDPQAGKAAPEQHMVKLLRDAQDAGECAALSPLYVRLMSLTVLARFLPCSLRRFCVCGDTGALQTQQQLVVDAFP